VLLQLSVKNYALIEDMQLDFSPGLNVLSGETGAGKSIIIGAIGLILGERAAAEHVREGARGALIEALFEWGGELSSQTEELLKEAGVEPEDTLLISREVFREGRSVGRINGRMVPVSFLKKLGACLVDLHGQHQHQSLLNPEQQLEMLDEYGREKIEKVRKEVAGFHQKRKNYLDKLQELGKDEQERERQKEILRYQIKEIEEANLSLEEEKDLLYQHNLLTHAEKLYNHVSLAYHALVGEEEAVSEESLRDRLSKAQQEVEEAFSVDSSLEGAKQMLQDAMAQIEEATLELGNYRENISFDPLELEKIQERLEEIKRLKKKYGSSLEQVLQFAEARKEELDKLERSEEIAQELEKELKEVEQSLQDACFRLTELRKEMAELLEKELGHALLDLALEKARLSISIVPENTFSPRGWDRVEFLFSANPGEPLKPLNKIISGGEMSRVMLALKSILAMQDRIPTLIFDEVDTGIGGQTIQTVAEKMADLSGYHQLLCVTHSPQIAAMADNHLLLYKEETEGRTVTKAFPLGYEERKKELARMLDGGLDPVNLKHVETFMNRAAEIKKK